MLFSDVCHIDEDMAQILSEQYAAYQNYTVELPELDEAYILDKLHEAFREDTVGILIDDDFGKGLLMGFIAYMFIREEILKEADDVYDGE